MFAVSRTITSLLSLLIINLLILFSFSLTIFNSKNTNCLLVTLCLCKINYKSNGGLLLRN